MPTEHLIASASVHWWHGVVPALLRHWRHAGRAVAGHPSAWSCAPVLGTMLQGCAFGAPGFRAWRWRAGPENLFTATNLPGLPAAPRRACHEPSQQRGPWWGRSGHHLYSRFGQSSPARADCSTYSSSYCSVFLSTAGRHTWMSSVVLVGIPAPLAAAGVPVPVPAGHVGVLSIGRPASTTPCVPKILQFYEHAQEPMLNQNYKNTPIKIVLTLLYAGTLLQAV